jgi:DNA-nicking Smr family endonuclease
VRGRNDSQLATGFSICKWVAAPTLACLNSIVDDEPIQLPIDGVLDLHTFQPREVKDLVLDYLAECRSRGILRVRIIHGKGIGNLRRTVHAILEKHPDVASFNLANEHFGGWGATIVHLRPDKPDEK